MAYNRTFWVDHVVDQHGEIIQQGTLMDQVHFNNIEHGIADDDLTHAIMQFKNIQEDYDTIAEVLSVTLTGTENSGKWPFNNKEKTVALQQIREHIDYEIDLEVISYSGGRLGTIKILDRALNGFKLLHEGSATEVVLKVRVSGGMIH